MSAPSDTTPDSDAPSTRGDGSLWADPHDDGDLGDMLQELRVLLPGSQTLTAFLVILPFNSGFSQIQDEERYVYLAAFLCSLLSLILFTAPAAHHRIQRPLRDRTQFKTISTRLMVAGLVPLSAALVLSAQLAISQVIPERWVSLVCAGAVLVVIIIVWWSYPLWRQR